MWASLVRRAGPDHRLWSRSTDRRSLMPARGTPACGDPHHHRFRKDEELLSWLGVAGDRGARAAGCTVLAARSLLGLARGCNFVLSLHCPCCDEG